MTNLLTDPFLSDHNCLKQPVQSEHAGHFYGKNFYLEFLCICNAFKSYWT